MGRRLDTRYNKMLKKSITLHLSPLPNACLPVGRGREIGEGEQKEVNIWQPIYLRSKERDRLKRGGFATFTSKVR